jgi:hypothetical protein
MPLVQDVETLKYITRDDAITNKIVKDVAIAHSGIYKYAREELPTIGIALDSIPEKYNNLLYFNVYRPALLMEGAADMFTRLPVTVEHPDSLVNADNFGDLAKGFTGDSVKVIMEDNEAYIHSTVTLIGQAAIDYYTHDCKEVSPGYVSDSIWEDGVHNGEDYQIKMTSIKGVNHLAMTVAARGGSLTCVRDSKAVREMISEVKDHKAFIPEIIKSIDDLPMTSDKQLLISCLNDMQNCDTMDSAIVNNAVSKISQLYDNIISENNKTGGNNMDKKEKTDPKATTDYAPGAVGIAGSGTQDKPAAQNTAEKPIAGTTKDEEPDGDEGKKGIAVSSSEAGHKEPDGDEDPVVAGQAKILNLLEQILKAVSPEAKKAETEVKRDDIDAEKDAKKEEMLGEDSCGGSAPAVATHDSAIISSVIKDSSDAIDNFMKEMRS